MSDRLNDEDLLDALDWISRRCPDGLENDMDQPHRVHVEAAWDAGQCARAAMTRYQARKEEGVMDGVGMPVEAFTKGPHLNRQHIDGPPTTDNEVERLRRQIGGLERALCFFQSVIKSGEPWSEHCEQTFLAALQKDNSDE